MDITEGSDVALRAEMLVAPPRFAVVLVVVRGAAVRAVFALPVVRDDTVVAVRDMVASERGFSAVVRGVVVRATLVAVRDWVVSVSDFVRETAVPSRTAALAKPTQINKFVIKTRIFFISGVKFSKNTKNDASE